MKEKGINFGGEQSGHIIFSDTAKNRRWISFSSTSFSTYFKV